jgi:hypothetical protein
MLKKEEQLHMKLLSSVATATAVLTACTFIWNQKADAGRLFARGANGAAGAYANSGTWGARGGGAVLGPNAGGGIRGGKYLGPNGGQLQAGGGFGYKRGTGAFRRSGWSGTAANGASGSGYTRNTYNAQTGQGARSSSEQVQTAAGKDYGYNGNTTYAKGEGGNSVIQTDNKGTYDVDWQKGQAPVVTHD